MTDALLVPDVDLVTLVDEATLAPCDWQWVEVRCEHPAAWSHRCAGCAHIVLVCHEHRLTMDAAVKRGRSKGMSVGCAQCEHLLADPTPWLPL